MGPFDLDELMESTALGVLDDEYVTRALLQSQYFPHVKKDGEELPPIFSSKSFSMTAAERLRATKPKPMAWVEFRTRRFDGLMRRLGIPHPVPYARLVLHIRDHWGDLVPRLESEHAQIRPTWHDDGRIIQMDYADPTEQHRQYTRLAQGKRYLVKADISNCFPSIYSHALDWALRGKDQAKFDQRSNGTWESKTDMYARHCMNGETKGLLIGPAISNLLAELVLQRIDGDLEPAPFVRYIDDYAAYFSTREEAEGFVVRLQRALSAYHLDLNTRKTKIISLREGASDAWMAEVLSHLPAEDSDLAAVLFLQHAEHLAQLHPSVSVLKFAAKTLLDREGRADRGSLLIVDELIRITEFHPHLLPTLSREIDKLDTFTRGNRERLAGTLRAQLVRAVHGAETDSILWLLYILRSQLKMALKLKANTLQEILELDDDLVWLALSVLSPRHTPEVGEYVRNRGYPAESDRQAHWLARFEFWRTGRMGDGDMSAEELRWMELLRDQRVTFSGLQRPSR